MKVTQEQYKTTIQSLRSNANKNVELTVEVMNTYGKTKTRAIVNKMDKAIKMARDAMYDLETLMFKEYPESLIVKPIPDIKGTKTLFENEE